MPKEKEEPEFYVINGTKVFNPNRPRPVHPPIMWEDLKRWEKENRGWLDKLPKLDYARAATLSEKRLLLGPLWDWHRVADASLATCFSVGSSMNSEFPTSVPEGFKWGDPDYVWNPDQGE